MKYVISILSFYLICGIANAEVKNNVAVVDELANPSNYLVEVYKGKTVKPDSIKKDVEGHWRDRYGKTVSEPKINFAGKYFVSVHSCGLECRYYQMHNLENGKEIPVFDMFASGDPPPTTKNGWRYTSILNFRKDSNLLVAQYLIEKNFLQDDGEYETKFDCRERSYIFENEKLKPISRTRNSCTDWNKLK
jgi:hypothetical protein